MPSVSSRHGRGFGSIPVQMSPGLRGQGSVHGTGWGAWGQSLTAARGGRVERVVRGASRSAYELLVSCPELSL